MIFFTSDTHFQHANVINFSKRPYVSVQEMNDALVQNWQKTVTDSDIIYHLGDVTWKWNAEMRDIMSRLPGQKHLLVGNHDHSATRNSKVWTSVQDYMELDIGGTDGKRHVIVLCHYPFAVWKGSHLGAINLHGHSHGTYPTSRQQMDVGVDCVGYGPISLPDVIARLQTFEPIIHRDAHRPQSVLEEFPPEES